jgi:predicted glycoside hydrolase/deacetylase ChbG (UPF0249 family)
VPDLIITCDDCGLSEGINEAALDLHRRGIATTASVITNFPATAHALSLFSQHPSLEVGVHLNLTDGFALTTSPELVDASGRFHSRYSLFAKAIRPTTAFLAAVQAELAAQIEVCRRAGLTPRHLTTHLHFHVLPPLRQIVLSLASHYSVAWVRAYRWRATVLPFNPLSAKPIASAATPTKTPDYLVAMKYWMRQDPRRLAVLLNCLQGIVELVVHPCTPDDETFPRDIRYSPLERYSEMCALERVCPYLSRDSDDTG